MSQPPEEGSNPTIAYDSAKLANIAAAVRELDHPTTIGPYFVLGMIGEGGMGTVYRAEQREPIQRIVAIKLIKLGMDTREVISRFEAERQVLAMMDHPNVARVIDAGATVGGSPYFVMEYVKGESITSFADRHKLNVRQRLELFMQACEAVQHAHQKGIIHRDLKPSNILVSADENGKPRVKVIDFGVAKALDQRKNERTYFTVEGRLLGTPEYMPPEQADARGDEDVDTRGDVYSLGVVLYELLTGSLPFDPQSLRSAGYAEIQRIIREVDPPRPSTRLSDLSDAAREKIAQLRQTSLDALEKQLKSELEWIPLKAMRKDRSQRYGAATELAEDVQNYLAQRPLRAGPETRAYRAKKFLRRNRGPVTAAALVVIVLIAGIIGTAWQAIRAHRESVRAMQESDVARRERDAAKVERDNAEAVVKFFSSDVIGAADPAQTHGKPVTVQEAVDKAAAKIDKTPIDRPLIDASVRLSISDAYRALGKYELALPYAKRAYEIRREQLGDDAFPTIVALSRYSNVLIYLRRPAEAEPLVRQILASMTKLKGPDDPETHASENNFANVLVQQGNYADAAPIFRKLYELATKDKGVQNYDAAVCAVNYSGVLYKLGQYADAEHAAREAYDFSVKTYGMDDPDTCMYGTTLAVILSDMGRSEEAVELSKKIWDARVRVMGKDSIDAMQSGVQYANSLAFVGRGDEGAAILKEIVAGQSARDPNGRQTLESMTAYGQVLNRVGKHEEAAAVLHDLWERGKVALEPDHPDTLTAQMNYAGELVLLHRAAEAEPILRDVHERQLKRLGPQHPLTLFSNGKLAIALLQLNRPQEAEELARAALDGLKRVPGMQRANIVKTAQVLATALEDQHRDAEAQQIRREYDIPAATQSTTTQMTTPQMTTPQSATTRSS